MPKLKENEPLSAWARRNLYAKQLALRKKAKNTKTKTLALKSVENVDPRQNTTMMSKKRTTSTSASLLQEPKGTKVEVAPRVLAKATPRSKPMIKPRNFVEPLKVDSALVRFAAKPVPLTKKNTIKRQTPTQRQSIVKRNTLRVSMVRSAVNREQNKFQVPPKGDIGLKKRITNKEKMNPDVPVNIIQDFNNPIPGTSSGLFAAETCPTPATIIVTKPITPSFKPKVTKKRRIIFGVKKYPRSLKYGSATNLSAKRTALRERELRGSVFYSLHIKKVNANEVSETLPESLTRLMAKKVPFSINRIVAAKPITPASTSKATKKMKILFHAKKYPKSLRSGSATILSAKRAKKTLIRKRKLEANKDAGGTLDILAETSITEPCTSANLIGVLEDTPRKRPPLNSQSTSSTQFSQAVFDLRQPTFEDSQEATSASPQNTRPSVDQSQPSTSWDPASTEESIPISISSLIPGSKYGLSLPIHNIHAVVNLGCEHKANKDAGGTLDILAETSIKEPCTSANLITTVDDAFGVLEDTPRNQLNTLKGTSEETAQKIKKLRKPRLDGANVFKSTIIKYVKPKFTKSVRKVMESTTSKTQGVLTPVRRSPRLWGKYKAEAAIDLADLTEKERSETIIIKNFEWN